jgi:hypothetical protein
LPRGRASPRIEIVPAFAQKRQINCKETVSGGQNRPPAE